MRAAVRASPSGTEWSTSGTPSSAWTSRSANSGWRTRDIPASRLVQGDLTALPVASATVDAVVSFYAIIHVPRQHARVFEECHRVLRPGGRALLCLGWGDNPEDHDPESWLGVPMFWSHFDAETNLALLRDAGFTIESSTEVPDPMAHASHQFVMVVRS